MNTPISPVRLTCVPPHSSTEKSPILSTRTTSPYFSPNSAMAPEAWASSCDINFVSTSKLARISRLTRASISVSCSGIIASKWEKSKRSRPASTSEPFCCTCSPSIWRSAACNKCVAEWLQAMSCRLCSSTFALVSAPTVTLPDCTVTRCKKAAPCFCVSCTVSCALPIVSTPQSPVWPPDSA